jgi:hypothetical protein
MLDVVRVVAVCGWQKTKAIEGLDWNRSLVDVSWKEGRI